MIESHTTRQFREAYANLPEEIRRQARQAYILFQKNPRHPGLRFKKVDAETNTFSVRVALGYRALGHTRRLDDHLVLDWLTHRLRAFDLSREL